MKQAGAGGELIPRMLSHCAGWLSLSERGRVQTKRDVSLPVVLPSDAQRCDYALTYVFDAFD